MSRKRKTFIIILSILIALTLAFIWGNSMRGGTKSTAQSESTYSSLQGVLDFIFGKGGITHLQFRKLAHFGEFFVLGIEINLLYIAIKRYKLKRIYEVLGIGLLVGIIDELIQFTTDRAPSIIDAIIDFGGIVVATGIIMLITLIINKKKNKTHA